MNLTQTMIEWNRLPQIHSEKEGTRGLVVLPRFPVYHVISTTSRFCSREREHILHVRRSRRFQIPDNTYLHQHGRGEELKSFPLGSNQQFGNNEDSSWQPMENILSSVKRSVPVNI